MASSWKEYDASQRRGSGGSGHGSTSSLSTKKRRSGSSSSTAAAAAAAAAASSSASFSSGNGTTGGKRKAGRAAPTGIDALYVDAPRGIDTRLQFQWIRPHPSSAILAMAAAAAASTAASKSGGVGSTGTSGSGAISPSIVEAARLVKHYRQAKADTGTGTGANGDSEKDSPDKSKKRRKLPKVDLGCINATVELTSLFDPPLLSEWGTPGVNMSILYDDNKNDDQGTFSDEDSDSDTDERYVHRANAGGTSTDGTSKQSSAAEMESALCKLVQCAATKGATRLEESTKQLFCDVSSSGSLLECLPSRVLLQKVQDAASTAAADGASHLQIGVISLTLLADITQTESMGRHILSVLAPVLLSSSSATSTSSMGTEHNIATPVELLAKALIHRCGLQKLSKADLLKFAESGEIGPSKEPSDFMDQFLIALGKAYHE